MTFKSALQLPQAPLCHGSIPPSYDGPLPTQNTAFFIRKKFLFIRGVARDVYLGRKTFFVAYKSRWFGSLHMFYTIGVKLLGRMQWYNDNLTVCLRKHLLLRLFSDPTNCMPNASHSHAECCVSEYQIYALLKDFTPFTRHVQQDKQAAQLFFQTKVFSVPRKMQFHKLLLAVRQG